MDTRDVRSGDAGAGQGVEDRVRRQWIKNANLPVKQEFDLSELVEADSPLHEWVQQYCRGTLTDPGRGLALVGPPGHGKTTLAVAIARHVLLNAEYEVLGWTREYKCAAPVHYVPYFTYVEMQKRLWKLERQGRMNSEEYDEIDSIITGIAVQTIDPIWQTRLALLDDVGKEYHSGTGWAEGELNGLLRNRHHYGLPTIVTTNIPLSTWAATYGAALGSFAKEAFLEVPVFSPTGEDRR